MSDRLLGYIVISALLIFLILPVSFLLWKTLSSGHSCVIEFSPINSIGFINFQDPVYVKGVEVGQVRRVINADQKVYTIIETKEKLTFYNDYTVSVIPKGIMGDRYLEIEPGTAASGLLSSTDTLLGTFIIGPAEAISYVDRLRSKIDQLSELMYRLKNGTIENKSLITGFWQSLETFDSLSSSIFSFTETLQRETEQKLDSIVEFLKKSTDVTMRVSEILPSFLQKIENLIVQSNQLVQQLRSISEQSAEATEQLKNPDLLIWSEKLKVLQNELKNAIEVIEKLEVEGLKIPIRLSGRRNKQDKAKLP
jgi:hypothetical protein